eukprot:268965-Prymnesium_polylepis.1
MTNPSSVCGSSCTASRHGTTGAASGGASGSLATKASMVGCRAGSLSSSAVRAPRAARPPAGRAGRANHRAPARAAAAPSGSRRRPASPRQYTRRATRALRAAETRLRLAQHLDRLGLARRRVERCVAQHGVHQIEQLLSALEGRLAADAELADGLQGVSESAALANRLLVEHGRGEASRARADGALQPDDVHSGGAQLEEQLRVEPHQRQLLKRHTLKVEQNVGVEHAGRRQAVREQRAAARQRRLHGGQRPDRPLEVGKPDARDGREVLRRVLLQLRRLEARRLRDDLRQLLVAHRRLGRRELLLLGSAQPVGHLRVGHQLDGVAVGVVDEHRPQKALEDRLAGRQPPLERSKRRLEPQRVERGAAPVDPARYEREHHGEALGVRARVELAQVELDRVERRLDRIGREALVSDGLERVEDQALDGAHVGRVDALEANREGRLLELRLEAAAHDRLTQPALRDGLVERRRRRAH